MVTTTITQQPVSVRKICVLAKTHLKVVNPYPPYIRVLKRRKYFDMLR